MLKQVYLDAASGTPLYPEVKEEICKALEAFGNPFSTHFLGQKSKALLEESRYRLADLLGVKPEQIIFTSGGTESNNLAIYNAVHHLGVSEIISSRLEHASVLNCLHYMQKHYGIVIKYVDHDSFGGIDLISLERLLSHSKDKKLVSLMHVNSELGNITDIQSIGQLCSDYEAFFHSDMVQSMGILDFPLSQLKYTFVTGSAHKFGGPKGCGFFVINDAHYAIPMLLGGGQEKGIRSGTECLHNILGAVKAAEISFNNKEYTRNSLQELKCYMVEQLQKELPMVSFNGYSSHSQKSAAHILNVLFQDIQDTHQQLHFKLSLKGIACSQGSACQSGSNSLSHVIRAILPDEKVKYPSLRFSFYRDNTKEEVDYLIEVLKERIKL